MQEEQQPGEEAGPSASNNGADNMDVDGGYVLVDDQENAQAMLEPPRTVEEEKDRIRNASKDAGSMNDMKEGDIWYPVAQKWYEEWQNYTGYERGETGSNTMWPSNNEPGDEEKAAARPGPLNNDDLADPDNPQALKKPCIEGQDFVWVANKVWVMLQAWYGGGPAFPRKVYLKPTQYNWQDPEAQIDMYPVFLTFYETDANGDQSAESTTRPYRRGTTLWEIRHDIVARVADGMEVDADGANEGKEGEAGSLDADDEKTDENYGKTDYQKARLFIRKRILYPVDAGAEDPDAESWIELTEEMYDGDTTIFPKKHHFTVQSGVLRGDTQSSTIDVLVDRNASTETGAYNKAQWRRQKTDMDLRVGDMVDVHDPRSKAEVKWFEALITQLGSDENAIARDEGDVKVHYILWAVRYDEWISKEKIGTKLANRGVYTNKVYRTAKSPFYEKKPVSTAVVISGTGSSTRDDRYSTKSYWNSNEEGTPIAKGICGLRNLGNTCFMNSTIQCLAQAPGLTDFFLNDDYKPQINADNPLGWKGRIAEEWADLVKNMFGEKYKVVSPRTLKQAIGEFQPRFMGYQQQDSQELLAFLLDGLHEDLNRIQKKPYTEDVEGDGRPDEVVSAEAWHRYKMRNDSVIVDTCSGQFKNRTTCPNCNYVHIKFDPFFYLSVPLPMSKTKDVPYTWVGFDGRIMAYGAKCKKSADIKQFRKDVAKQNGLEPTEAPRFVVADVWKSKVHRKLKIGDSVNSIKSNDDIYVYHIDLPGLNEFYGVEPDPDAKAPLPIQIVMQKIEKNPHYKPSYTYSKPYTSEAFGVPLMTAIPPVGGITNKQVYNQITQLLRPWIHAEPELPAGAEPLAADELPYEIKYKEAGYSYNAKEFDLLPDDDAYEGGQKVKLLVNWTRPEYYNIDLAEECPRDASAPAKKKTSYSYGGGGGGTPIELSACLDEFSVEEELDEENKFYCNKCKTHVQASRKMDLWKMPDLLCVHLKRFNYTKYWRDKISTTINFPVDTPLDLSKWIVNPAEQGRARYRLYAVSNHMGGMGGGHYTAYARSKENAEWYELNDSSASKVRNVDEIVGSSSYVLFFERDSAVKVPS